ncbi:hypothetical protein M9Y10_028260 [Tritrichomonas musculus]|uniref:FCP1 homology domain-containing protein n=1 Tax=Tritrichomonas musculus TaxID=1915356 RepID=A0ABR2KIT1_9EUKA
MSGNDEESLLKNQNSSPSSHPQRRVVIAPSALENQEVKKTRMETDVLQIMKEPYVPRSYLNQNQTDSEKQTTNDTNQFNENKEISSVTVDIVDNLIASRISNNNSLHHNFPKNSLGQLHASSSLNGFSRIDEPSLVLENYTTVEMSDDNNIDFINRNESASCCSICNLSKKTPSQNNSNESKSDSKNSESSNRSTDTDFSDQNVSINQPDHNLTSYLLPQADPDDMDKLCLVVDLDETLVHSSITQTGHPDLVLTLQDSCMESKRKKSSSVPVTVYVNFRPGAEEFIANLAPLYEMVFFTTSSKEYADLVLNKLDPCRMVKHRLFRDNCTELGGNFVKDLSRMNRDLDRIIIIDNNPTSYMLQPTNAIAISSWFEDPKDKELSILQHFLIRNASAQSISEIFR